MSYPLFGMPVSVAFVLAVDVVKYETGGWYVADKHYHSGQKQFGELWTAGVAAAVGTLARHVVIVGGHEARYPKERIEQPDVLRELVIAEGADPRDVSTKLSEPHTSGNVVAIREWIDEHHVHNDRYIVMCPYWHVPRVQLVLEAQGIRVPIVPVEAALLASCVGDAAARTQGMIDNMWGRTPFTARAVSECSGIADVLRGTYVPLNSRAQLTTAAE